LEKLKDWQLVNGHDEADPIEDGGTDSIYFWPFFEA